MYIIVKLEKQWTTFHGFGGEERSACMGGMKMYMRRGTDIRKIFTAAKANKIFSYRIRNNDNKTLSHPHVLGYVMLNHSSLSFLANSNLIAFTKN